MEVVSYLAAAVGAYLLGSIPTGYLWGRARGIDIRTIGSGNIGATNVMRALGKGPGITVLVLDALKGFLPVFFAPQLWPALDGEWLQIICCLAVVAGHNWTCWLHFSGGKGIATSAGAMLGILPLVLAVALAVWVTVFAATRYVSLGSICASLTLPVTTWWWNGDPALIGFTFVVAILAVWRHRANIRRLLAGTENRVGPKR